MDDYSHEFICWWNLYPRKACKRDAYKAFQDALKRVSWEELMRRTLLIMETPKAKSRWCPYPATFLRRDRWEDDLSEWQRGDEPDPLDAPLREARLRIAETKQKYLSERPSGGGLDPQWREKIQKKVTQGR